MREPAGEAGHVVGILWWHVLGPPESADDEQEGFVSLGGYSLAAARFIGAVRDRLGVEIPLDLLLGMNATLSDIRALVAASDRAPEADPAERPGYPQPQTRRAGSAMAPSQRRLWLLSRLHPESAAYNVVVALRLQGTLSVQALRAALTDVTARHDALRACVVEDSGTGPRLMYAASARPGLEVRQTALPLTQPVLAGFIRDVAAQPIALDAAPLLHAALLRSAGAGSADACLVISIHHIVSDQRSADLILSDLATAYAARLDGQPPRFSPAPSFADHADAEAASRHSWRWAEDLRYWRELLHDPPEIQLLPFPLRSSPAPSFHGEAHELDLGPELSRMIDSYARAHGVTPAMLLLACIAVVQCAWTGTKRTIIGMPASRRRTDRDQDLVGFLVETLPILVDVGRQPDVAALVRHVRDRHVAALGHAAPTFDAIAEAVQLPPRLLTSPLFQVWFNDLTQGSAAPVMPGLAVSAIPTPGFAALFDLNFYLHRGALGYRLQLVRAVSLVREETAAEMLAQCRTVLDQILTDVSTAPGSLRLDTPRARAAWARSKHLVAPSRASATRPGRPDPAATALSTPLGEVTYAQLDHLVSALSEQLTAAGVTPGAVVEIRARRAGGLPLALLASWRLGAVTAFVDGTLPAARIAECQRLLRPSAVLNVDPGAAAGVEIGRGSTRPRSLPGASHVLFTSGSGGRQLAVAVARASIEASLTWYSDAFAPCAEDRVALLAGLGHDPVLRDMLVPLRSGGTILVPPRDVFTAPGGLLDLLAMRRVTILHATPALLELLHAAHMERPGIRLDAMRLIVCAGAPLTAGLVRRLRALTPAAVVNAYGATETPQIVARSRVLEYGESADAALADYPDHTILPIGHGVAGAGLLVCMPDGQPAGVGQAGEIIVRSGDLAIGYLDTEETDARFIADPYAMPGIRAFRTRDLGRLAADGKVHIADRMDRQLNIDGFRIAPEEIESAARRLPTVAQAVAGLVNAPAGPALALQVVPAPGTHLATNTVRSHLRTQLPTYALPSIIAVVPKLATNANHKLVLNPGITDTEGLASPGAAARRDGCNLTGAAPAEELTAWLAGVLREVTGRDIAPDENFFDAGLTSMSLLRLHAHVAGAIRDAPPATALFAYPTVRAFAMLLAGSADPEPAARRRPGGADLEDLGREAQRRRDLRRGRQCGSGSLVGGH